MICDDSDTSCANCSQDRLSFSFQLLPWSLFWSTSKWVSWSTRLPPYSFRISSLDHGRFVQEEERRDATAHLISPQLCYIFVFAFLCISQSDSAGSDPHAHLLLDLYLFVAFSLDCFEPILAKAAYISRVRRDIKMGVILINSTDFT